MEDLNVDKFISETSIDPLDLDSSFTTQSALRAYYGSLASQCEATASRKKMIRDITEAKLYKALRDQATAEGVKMTEKALENAIKLDAQWIKACDDYIDAQCRADVAKSFVMSLADRKDMLIQIGADRRDETKGQMRMMEAQTRAENFNRAQEAIRKQSYNYQ